MHRAISIVCTVTGESEETAREALEKCGFHCKTAIVSLLLGLEPEAARKALDEADGRVALALKQGGRA